MRHDRETEQVRVRSVSAELIMRRAAFAAGVADKRAGRAPRYDDFSFDQSTADSDWDYERGRLWACLAPLSMPLKVNGKLNPKAVAVFEAASRREYIR